MQAFERMRSISIDMMDHLISINEASDSGIFRQTVIIVTIFFLYIGLGMLIYHIMLGWDFIDSMYFVTITFSTVGYGDLDPKTPAERMFTAFYLLIGLIALASMLSVHLALLAEHNDALEAERNRRTAAKITEVGACLAAPRGCHLSMCPMRPSCSQVRRPNFPIPYLSRLPRSTKRAYPPWASSQRPPGA